MKGRMGLVVRDIDQAYEACDGAKVGVAWQRLATAAQQATGSQAILIRKGSLVKGKYPAGPYGMGWVKVDS